MREKDGGFACTNEEKWFYGSGFYLVHIRCQYVHVKCVIIRPLGLVGCLEPATSRGGEGEWMICDLIWLLVVLCSVSCSR